MENKLRPVRVHKIVKLEGMRAPEKVFAGRGLFHCWGQDFQEFESGPGNFTVGLVEMDGGHIVGYHFSMIQFMDQD